MSANARVKGFQPGDHFEYTNTTRKAVNLVLKTEWGTTVRTTLPIGGYVEFELGKEGGSLYILEAGKENEPLRVVKNNA